jgi:hypothetical protein
VRTLSSCCKFIFPLCFCSSRVSSVLLSPTILS